MGILSLLSGGCPAGEGEQKLAVVNVSAVFEKYGKVAEVQRQIDAKHKEQKDELQQRATELSKRNKELDELYDKARTEEAVFDLVQRLRKEQFRYERDLARLNVEIQKEYAREMRQVLSDIRVAVRAIAEKGGFELVLRSPDTDDPEVTQTGPDNPAGPSATESKTHLALTEPRTVAQVVERFNRNPVLYGARTVDITPDVLKKLNEDFVRRSGGAGAGTTR
ncbi:MAG: OmpH family outer membrane protein [Planctomycetota bacterium]|nr:OmpH family outer membrane protein [Planctomycetota bacterium]